MSYTKYKNLKSNLPVQFDSNESLGSISHSLCLVTSHWWLFIIWRTVNTAKVIYAFKIVLYFQYEVRKWASYKLRRHSKLKKKKRQLIEYHHFTKGLTDYNDCQQSTEYIYITCPSGFYIPLPPLPPKKVGKLAEKMML